jgi:hypothetical protein
MALVLVYRATYAHDSAGRIAQALHQRKEAGSHLPVPSLGWDPNLRSACRGQRPPEPLCLWCEGTDDGDGGWRMMREGGEAGWRRRGLPERGGQEGGRR